MTTSNPQDQPLTAPVLNRYLVQYAAQRKLEMDKGHSPRSNHATESLSDLLAIAIAKSPNLPIRSKPLAKKVLDLVTQS